MGMWRGMYIWRCLYDSNSVVTETLMECPPGLLILLYTMYFRTLQIHLQDPPRSDSHFPGLGFSSADSNPIPCQNLTMTVGNDLIGTHTTRLPNSSTNPNLITFSPPTLIHHLIYWHDDSAGLSTLRRAAPRARPWQN